MSGEPEDRPDALGCHESYQDSKHQDTDYNRPPPSTSQNQEQQPEYSRKDIDSLNYRKGTKQGRAVIINNKDFSMKDGEDISKKRNGSDNDRKVMEDLLGDLGFESIQRSGNEPSEMTYDDVTADQLKAIMADAANDTLNDYREYGCFICVILSFGDPGVIYCKGDPHNTPVELKTLQEPFKNSSSLRLKPKIFLIQGCPYTPKDRDDAPGGDAGPFGVKTMKIPRESDFLFHFSSQPGFTVWNFNKSNPSNYIEAFDRAVREFCINNKEDIDFLRVLTRINNYMHTHKDGDIAIPLVTSLLTKRLYFYKDLMRNTN